MKILKGSDFYGPGGRIDGYDRSQGPIPVAAGDQTIYMWPTEYVVDDQGNRWEAKYEGNTLYAGPNDQPGKLLGYTREVPLDPSRGTSGGEFAQYDTQGHEFVPVNEDGTLGAPQYMTSGEIGGGGLHSPAGASWMKPLALGAIGAITAGAGAETLGLFGPGGFNGMIGAAPAGTTGATAGSSAWAPFVGEDIVGAIASGGIPTGSLAPFSSVGPGGAWVGEDLFGAIAAGSTVPPGFTPPGFIPTNTLPLGPFDPTGVPFGTTPPQPFPQDIPPPPPTGGPPAPTTTNPTPNPAPNPKPGEPGFTWPTDAAGWLKLLGPVLGGAFAGWEANKNNGQFNGYQPAVDVLMGNAKRDPLARWNPSLQKLGRTGLMG